MSTASIPEAPKADPVCSQLASQIEVLRGEGVATKVENAAAKKYKMKPADLSKAAQLNKASEDFQARCGTVPVRSAAPSPSVPKLKPAAPAKSVAAAKSAAAMVPAAQPAAAGLTAQADAPAPKQLSPASIARAADAAAARAAMKSAQGSTEALSIGN